MDSRKELGLEGEEAALRDYLRRGYRLVERNWSVRQGEIDLIVRKQDTLVFIEVKTSDSSSSFRAIENITWQKRRKLRLLAELYLSTHELPALIQQIRLDGAEVIERDGSYEVSIFENIVEL